MTGRNGKNVGRHPPIKIIRIASRDAFLNSIFFPINEPAASEAGMDVSDAIVLMYIAEVDDNSGKASAMFEMTGVIPPRHCDSEKQLTEQSYFLYGFFRS